MTYEDASNNSVIYEISPVLFFLVAIKTQFIGIQYNLFIYFLLFQQNNLKAFTKVENQSFFKINRQCFVERHRQVRALGPALQLYQKTNKMINETFKS